MVVITLSSCPMQLRGDMTKWFVEIDTGVYVGNVSARIRELIWERITENVADGRAVMVYTCANEQGFDLKLHNAKAQRTDFDGMILTKFSKAEKEKEYLPRSRRKVRYGLECFMQDTSQYGSEGPRKAPGTKQSSKGGKESQKSERAGYIDIRDGKPDNYIIIDIETGGLDCETDPILELGALRVMNGQVTGRFDRLIRQSDPIKPYISQLTGITDQMLEEEGVPLEEALDEYMQFLGDEIVIGHNVTFDIDFIAKNLYRICQNIFAPRFIDTLDSVKKLYPGLKSYSLKNLLIYFGIEGEQKHRALADAELTRCLFEKVNVEETE